MCCFLGNSLGRWIILKNIKAIKSEIEKSCHIKKKHHRNQQIDTYKSKKERNILDFPATLQDKTNGETLSMQQLYTLQNIIQYEHYCISKFTRTV